MQKGFTRRTMLCAGAVIAAGCRAKRGSPFPGYAFVANFDGKSVAVVDLASFAVAKQIRLDDSPSALVLHPTKNVVYVLAPRSGTLYEIDTANLAILRRTHAVESAVTMRMTSGAAAPAIWILGSDGRLVKLELDAMRAGTQIRLADHATDFDISDKNFAGVAYGGSGAAGLVDLTAGTASGKLRVSDSIGAVRFRADGKMLIVADLAGRSLALFQAPGGRVISRLPLSVRPDNLCFNQDGGQLFVTGDGRDAVAIIYPYNVPEVAETVLAGRAPGPMTASKTYLFVTSPSAGDVSIFDLATHKTIAVAAVGAEPGYVAITPDDQYALVLNQKSGDVAVIRIGAIRNDRAKAAALFTMIPVGSKPVAAVIRAV